MIPVDSSYMKALGGHLSNRHHGLYTNKTATSDMRVRRREIKKTKRNIITTTNQNLPPLKVVVWTMPTEAEDFKYMGQCIFDLLSDHPLSNTHAIKE